MARGQAKRKGCRCRWQGPGDKCCLDVLQSKPAPCPAAHHTPSRCPPTHLEAPRGSRCLGWRPPAPARCPHRRRAGWPGRMSPGGAPPRHPHKAVSGSAWTACSQKETGHSMRLHGEQGRVDALILSRVLWDQHGLQPSMPCASPLPPLSPHKPSSNPCRAVGARSPLLPLPSCHLHRQRALEAQGAHEGGHLAAAAPLTEHWVQVVHSCSRQEESKCEVATLGCRSPHSQP